jgi:curved DNA-binding protein CbpA
MKEKNYYDIIGVSIFASQDDIRDAYLNKIKRYHPDTYEGSRENAERITAELNIAYATLKDGQKKLEYDIKNGFFNQREERRKFEEYVNNKAKKKEEAQIKKQQNKVKKEQFKKTQKEAKQKNKQNVEKTKIENKKKKEIEKKEKLDLAKEKLVLDIVIVSLLLIIILLIIFK